MEKTPPSKVIKFVFEKSGIKEMLKNQGDEGLERMENIEELGAFAVRYDGLPLPDGIAKILEDAALATDQDSLDGDPRGVRLSTVHASKGLEFDASSSPDSSRISFRTSRWKAKVVAETTKKSVGFFTWL